MRIELNGTDYEWVGRQQRKEQGKEERVFGEQKFGDKVVKVGRKGICFGCR